MKVVNVPIEPIPNRYSEDWAKWFAEELKNRAYSYTSIICNPIRTTIKDGAFLDVLTTQSFKAQQIQQICSKVNSGIIPRNERVVFLIHDGWFPIEQLAYIRDMLNCYDWRFIGIFHAGTYDPWDQTAQHKMYTWGESYENAMFKIYDKIVVASSYHRDLLCSTRQVLSDSIAVIPWKVSVPEFPMRTYHKKNQIVFPHRLNVEKQPDKFDKLALCLSKMAPDWTTISTASECTTKDEYYKTLQESKISVSFALQETFGIAMVESVLLGCIPLVPDRLSYSEMYPVWFKYEDEEELIYKISHMIRPLSFVRLKLPYLQDVFQRNSDNFFDDLFKIVGSV